MSYVAYWTMAGHWSLAGLALAVTAVLVYVLAVRPTRRQIASASVAAALLYIALGSPLSGMRAFGLHAAVMVSQLLLVLVVPLFLLPLLPARLVPNVSTRRASVAAWCAGALGMWGGHLFGAARLSAELGEPICGVSASTLGIGAGLPPLMLSGLLLAGGILFALPVFHPDPEKRMAPPRAVVYLFLSCVSCTLLGLWVTFTAAAASSAAILPLHAPFSAPLLPSRRTDQELAGMLMWVPGCLLYVTLSARLLLGWMEEKSPAHA